MVDAVAAECGSCGKWLMRPLWLQVGTLNGPIATGTGPVLTCPLGNHYKAICQVCHAANLVEELLYEVEEEWKDRRVTPRDSMRSAQASDVSVDQARERQRPLMGTITQERIRLRVARERTEDRHSVGKNTVNKMMRTHPAGNWPHIPSAGAECTTRAMEARQGRDPTPLPMLHHPNRKPVIERGSPGYITPTSELWEHARSIGAVDSRSPTSEAETLRERAMDLPQVAQGSGEGHPPPPPTDLPRGVPPAPEVPPPHIEWTQPQQQHPPPGHPGEDSRPVSLHDDYRRWIEASDVDENAIQESLYPSPPSMVSPRTPP